MKDYKSKSKKQSGVVSYLIDNESITVKFINNKKYKYTYSSTGKLNVEIMKNLAIQQQGLSTFISQNKPLFELKY